MACRALIGSQVKLGLRAPPREYPCENRCGRLGQVYHHPDYDRPEYVVPMCHLCHGRLHSVEASQRGHAAKSQRKAALWRAEQERIIDLIRSAMRGEKEATDASEA